MVGLEGKTRRTTLGLIPQFSEIPVFFVEGSPLAGFSPEARCAQQAQQVRAFVPLAWAFVAGALRI